MDWIEFVAAFAVFLGLHVVPVRPAIKQPLVGVLGRNGFTAAYSVASILLLGWLIVAAGRAPFVMLWPSAPWQAWVPVVAMAAACLLAALALGRPNPYSFGGPKDGFDPDNPGAVRLHRHPLLLALALWSGAHMVPNGDLAHVILFGIFAGFAVLGMRLIDRRRRRDMGAAWQDGLARVRAAPLATALRPAGPSALRVTLGVAAYLALFHLHPLLFGVVPLP